MPLRPLQVAHWELQCFGNKFYAANGNMINGKHIGSAGSYNDLGDTGDKAFDGDIITFYDGMDPGNSWTGLDFGEDKKIAAIRYSPDSWKPAFMKDMSMSCFVGRTTVGNQSARKRRPDKPSNSTLRKTSVVFEQQYRKKERKSILHPQ